MNDKIPVKLRQYKFMSDHESKIREQMPQSVQVSPPVFIENCSRGKHKINEQLCVYVVFFYMCRLISRNINQWI